LNKAAKQKGAAMSKPTPKEKSMTTPMKKGTLKQRAAKRKTKSASKNTEKRSLSVAEVVYSLLGEQKDAATNFKWRIETINTILWELERACGALSEWEEPTPIELDDAIEEGDLMHYVNECRRQNEELFSRTTVWLNLIDERVGALYVHLIGVLVR
jgi:hypothetical protein